LQNTASRGSTVTKAVVLAAGLLLVLVVVSHDGNRDTPLDTKEHSAATMLAEHRSKELALQPESDNILKKPAHCGTGKAAVDKAAAEYLQFVAHPAIKLDLIATRDCLAACTTGVHSGETYTTCQRKKTAACDACGACAKLVFDAAKRADKTTIEKWALCDKAQAAAAMTQLEAATWDKATTRLTRHLGRISLAKTWI